MAITSQYGLVNSPSQTYSFYKSGANIGSRYWSYPTSPALSNVAGFPAVFSFASTGASGSNVDGTTSTLGGTFPYTNPSSGNMYFSSANIGNNTGTLAICFTDILWYNTAMSVTASGAQTINSGFLPSRDANGNSNGVNVNAWLYITAPTTNSANVSNTTIAYTNSSGTAGRTATIAMPILSNSNSTILIPFALQAGDVGIRSIQSFNVGTSLVSGSVTLFLLRDIVFIGMTAITGFVSDWAQTGMPKLYNGSAISYYTYVSSANTAACSVQGTITLVNG